MLSDTIFVTISGTIFVQWTLYTLKMAYIYYIGYSGEIIYQSLNKSFSF